MAEKLSYGIKQTQCLPLLREGKTVHEIVALTGFTPKQIRNVREHARLRGLLSHPTENQTREARSKAHLGQPCPFKGKKHELVTIIKMRETRAGRLLTEMEKEQVRLLVAARKVPQKLGEPTLPELYEKNKRSPYTRGTVEGVFLETLYGARLRLSQESALNNGSGQKTIPISEILRIYETLDPSLIDRRKEDIAFIVQKTSRTSQKPARAY